MAAGVQDLTDATFKDAISGSDKPVLVDFWATWCGPCVRLAPIVEEIAADYGDKLDVCKLDIDENQQTAADFGIQSIPTLLVFKGGEVVDRIVGAQPKASLAQTIDRHV